MSVPMRWSNYSSTEIVNSSTPKPEYVLSSPSRPRRRSTTAAVWRLAIYSVVCLLAIVGFTSISSTIFSRNSSALSIDAQQGSKIRCSSVNVIRRNQYVSLSGDVLNQSARPLENVEVIVQLQDAEHHTLQMASALVASSTISPGRSTPFQIDISDDLKAVACRVWFRKLSGARLS